MIHYSFIREKTNYSYKLSSVSYLLKKIELQANENLKINKRKGGDSLSCSAEKDSFFILILKKTSFIPIFG